MNAQAQELCNRLNGPEGSGDEWWQNVVEDYDYDREATDQADRSYSSTIVVFSDGTAIKYSEPDQRWYVEEH